MDEEEYNQFPSFIIVRHLRDKVTQQGFRAREVTLATTLLDSVISSDEELASLYGRRWSVELHIRSLKTQMKRLFRDFSGLRAGVGEVFSGIAAMSEC